MLSGFYSLGRQSRNTFSEEERTDGGGENKDSYSFRNTNFCAENLIYKIAVSN
jgi:hypothetical protein